MTGADGTLRAAVVEEVKTLDAMLRAGIPPTMTAEQVARTALKHLVAALGARPNSKTTPSTSQPWSSAPDPDTLATILADIVQQRNGPFLGPGHHRRDASTLLTDDRITITTREPT